MVSEHLVATATATATVTTTVTVTPCDCCGGQGGRRRRRRRRGQQQGQPSQFRLNTPRHSDFPITSPSCGAALGNVILGAGPPCQPVPIYSQKAMLQCRCGRGGHSIAMEVWGHPAPEHVPVPVSVRHIRVILHVRVPGSGCVRVTQGHVCTSRPATKPTAVI